MANGTEAVFMTDTAMNLPLSGIITTPTNFDPETESLPLIVFLHGAGERGTNLEAVKVHGIPKLFSADPDYHGLRVVTASPQCPDGLTWNTYAIPLAAWIDAVIEKYHCDKSRVSITGLSMGGFGTWEMLCTYPEKFSCGAPICGGGLSWRADLLKGLPIRVYHGLDDSVVPIVYSQLMVDAARANGCDITLYAWDKVGHGSWVHAYEETDLVEWLISQKNA